MTPGENGTVPGSTQECVGKRSEMTDNQTGTETKRRTFTDAVKKGRLPQDLLSK